MIRSDNRVAIYGYSPEDYASLWGCGGEYDSLPNLPGDGVLFYNFSSEHVVRTAEWLAQFKAAIERTRQKVKNLDRRDYSGLTALLIYVEQLEPEESPVA